MIHIASYLISLHLQNPPCISISRREINKERPRIQRDKLKRERSMRPSSDSTSTINVWRSPTPYLFGSLGLLLAIIAVALTSLACSYYRNSSGDQEEKPAAMLTSMPVLHAEPEIVVVMAGEDKPTYLAAPL
jgi:hypothetical protein